MMIGIADILSTTVDQTGFTVEQICGPRRIKPLVVARHRSMLLARELTDLSLPQIGFMFGGRDHTSVLHGIRAAEERISLDLSERRAHEDARQKIMAIVPTFHRHGSLSVKFKTRRKKRR